MYGNLHVSSMQDHYLVSQAQDGAGYPRSCLKKTGILYFLLFFLGLSDLRHKSRKTQTLGLLLVWVELKKTQKTQTQKTQKPKPKKPTRAITGIHISVRQEQ